MCGDYHWRDVLGVSSDAVLEAENIPLEAPNANSIAERWMRSVREECLNRLIILDARHLRRVLSEYVAYYNVRRLHPGIDQDSPLGLQFPCL
jgi:transposase InsO family protein